MTSYVFFDTETTGFANAGGRICQLAAVLATENRRVLGSMNTLIEPDGWEIPYHLTKNVHGISTQDCTGYGVPIEKALMWFAKLVKGSEGHVVAHNITFDMGMLEVENAVCKARTGKSLKLTQFTQHCTMAPLKDVMKLPFPKSKRAGYKNPKLMEAYYFYNGKEFEGAHDAMNDVTACMDVFFKHKAGEKGGHFQIPNSAYAEG